MLLFLIKTICLFIHFFPPSWCFSRLPHKSAVTLAKSCRLEVVGLEPHVKYDLIRDKIRGCVVGWTEKASRNSFHYQWRVGVAPNKVLGVGENEDGVCKRCFSKCYDISETKIDELIYEIKVVFIRACFILLS